MSLWLESVTERDFAVHGLRWAVALLEQHGHPGTLWLHPLDYRRFGAVMVPSAYGVDAVGPYLWFLGTQVRPKPRMGEVDLSAERIWP